MNLFGGSAARRSDDAFADLHPVGRRVCLLHARNDARQGTYALEELCSGDLHGRGMARCTLLRNLRDALQEVTPNFDLNRQNTGYPQRQSLNRIACRPRKMIEINQLAHTGEPVSRYNRFDKPDQVQDPTSRSPVRHMIEQHANVLDAADHGQTLRDCDRICKKHFSWAT